MPGVEAIPAVPRRPDHDLQPAQSRNRGEDGVEEVTIVRIRRKGQTQFFQVGKVVDDVELPGG